MSAKIKTTVNIIGNSTVLTNKDYRKAIRWYILEMCGKYLATNIVIYFRLINQLKIKEGVHADCVWEERNIKPREFTIRIDSSLNIKQQLIAIAHECVHVKQFARGELFDFYRDNPMMAKSRWKRRVYNTDYTKYKNQPWEVEATKLEKELYRAYVKSNNE